MLTSNSFLRFLNPLPYNAKHNASNNVDLPAPFSPRISVVSVESNYISVNELPDDNKFLFSDEIDLSIEDLI